MKQLKGVWLLALMVWVSACSREDFADVGEPLSFDVENVSGTWQLASISQVDNNAVDRGFPAEVQRLDLKAFFPAYEQYVVRLETNPQGEPTNFAVENPGGAPSFFPATGNWQFDDAAGPRRLRVTDGSGDETMIDFTGAFRQSENRLAIGLVRRQDGRAFLTYELIFERQ